jgi:hypothetical protein
LCSELFAYVRDRSLTATLKWDPKWNPEVPMNIARPLTDTQLRRLMVTGARYELADPGLPGLALRISSKGLF